MDAFDEDLYGDLTVDMNQELTYVEVKYGKVFHLAESWQIKMTRQ